MPSSIFGASSSVAGGSGWSSAGAWTYVSADAPSFVFSETGDLTATYSPGMRVKYTQTTVKYGIVTKVALNGGVTEVTIYGGTDYTLANAAITNPYYSFSKAPQGFPLSPAKWTVTVTDTSGATQASPAQNTWYNINNFQLVVPIGCWDVDYQVGAGALDASGATWTVMVTLSTANNTESNGQFTAYFDSASVTRIFATISRWGIIELSAKTTHYLNLRTTVTSLDNLYLVTQITCVIRAVCAYL